MTYNLKTKSNSSSEDVGYFYLEYLFVEVLLRAPCYTKTRNNSEVKPMKRYMLASGLVLLVLMIAGCGGGGGNGDNGGGNNGGIIPGSISGIISDVNGVGIAKAVITINPTATSVTTQNDGTFNFPDVPPGDYFITAAAEGFCTFNVAAQITSEKDTVKNIKLVSNEGLLAWYPLNGTANDLSGNAHNGTIKGSPIPTTNHLGRINGAYLFNDNDSYDYIEAPSIFNNPEKITVSVWAKHLSVQEDDAYVFYHGQGGEFSIRFIKDIGDLDSRPIVQVRVASGNWYGNTGDNILSEWVNLTGVWKKNTMMQLYQDGVGGRERTLTSAAEAGIYTDSGSELMIGRYHYGGYFHGVIADLRIFNRVLSCEEIAALAER